MYKTTSIKVCTGTEFFYFREIIIKRYRTNTTSLAKYCSHFNGFGHFYLFDKISNEYTSIFNNQNAKKIFFTAAMAVSGLVMVSCEARMRLIAEARVQSSKNGFGIWDRDTIPCSILVFPSLVMAQAMK
jgi:hypothetical protein